MAEMLGINERSYQNIETGKYSPSYKTTLAIISHFGIAAYNHLIAFEGFGMLE
jgi:DNA-binding XRE family transcriptional regulator